MHRSTTRLSRSVASAVLAALQAAAVSAQAAEPTQQLPKISVGAPAPASEDSYKRDSASSPKYTQPLLDTPQTITVIPPALIKQQGATTLRDILRNSPGITFQAGEGGAVPGDQNFSMRGFSSRNSIFIDGVRDAGPYTRDSFNLEQVEIIKGPTGAVAGRSATSGAINQVAKTPHADDAQDYSLGYGSDDYKRVTTDLNFGLSDSMALRVNAMYHDAEVSNRDVVENQRWGIAPSLALGLGTPTRFTLSYVYLEEDNVPDYGLPWLSIEQTTASDPAHNGSFPTGAFEASPPVRQSNFYGLKDYDFEDIESQVATAQIEHDFSETLSLRSVLRYLDTDRSSAITSPRPPNRQLQRRDIGTQNITSLTDLTLRFDTGSIGHTLVAGVELAREKLDNQNSSQTANQPSIADFYFADPNARPFGPLPANSGNPSETRVETIAVYAMDTVALTDQWQLSAGLRRDDAQIDFDSRNFATGAVIDDLSKSEEELTWHAAVIFKPLPSGTVYLSYGTGFDPTFDAGTAGAGLSSAANAANNVYLKPERSSNVELGTKWELLDARLALNAAVFRMEKENVRTRTGAGGNTEPFILDGEQRVQGIELSAAGIITDAWSIFSGATYLDSEFEQSANSLEQGQELLLVPDLSFNVWTTYALPLGITVGAGVQYTDEYVRTRTAALGEITVPDYTLIDAMVSYEMNRMTTLRLNATNLADEDYVDRVGGGHYVPGPGRTISLTASFAF
jgi:catecholate siderophore receptor